MPLRRLRNKPCLLVTPRRLKRHETCLLSFSKLIWLWDDHLRHLGYPPRFHRVQDAISCNNSWAWCHFGVILNTNHQHTCFRAKVTFKKKNKAPARKPANSRPEWGSTPRWSLFQNLGTGKFKTCVNEHPSKSNPGCCQKMSFSKSQQKVPTNTANWSCGLINPSGHLYFYFW